MPCQLFLDLGSERLEFKQTKKTTATLGKFMFEHPQLEALSAVIRLGSFDAAASHLSVTPSAVSQRIKQLEDRIGMILVQRGQPCTATQVAQKLLIHNDQMQLLERGLALNLGLSVDATAAVRIAVNADSLATWLLPALAQVDGFLFNLIIDDQDHSESWLKNGEVAAAITSRVTPLQGCDCYQLGALQYVATASPDFIARYFSDGLTAKSFSNAPALTFNSKDRLQRDWAASVIGKAVNIPTHYIASAQGFVDATVLGIGWGVNPRFLVEDHIKEGRLKPLAPDWPLETPLSWQVSRLTANALKPVTEAISAAAVEFL
jgi:LysR family transcriptional regulator (chromosome initiation inhibitor)